MLPRIQVDSREQIEDAVDAVREADPRRTPGEARVSSGRWKLTLRAGSFARRWGVVLAGGDGVRLQGLTRLICGDDRPKQFCPLFGEGTLLDQTRRRAERSILPDQIVYSVTKAHEKYYRRESSRRSSQRIVQPSNRGTAPAILSSLVRVFQTELEAIVAIFPCDHYYSPENAFTAALESAFLAAEERSESVVLLGAEPKAPEADFGWIELGEKTGASCCAVHRIRRFVEKPSPEVAAQLFRTGSLWNTFVMVGHVRTFLKLAVESVPEVMNALGGVKFRPTAGGEIRIEDWVYDRIAPADFSRQVLSPGVARLTTMTLEGVEWNDLGDPERLICILAENNSELPAWARRWRARREAKVEDFSASAAVA
ncbi:MAG TPA: sugar phosphate nucleotidyltransferase [Bryobacteraceae bacterium]